MNREQLIIWLEGNYDLEEVVVMLRADAARIMELEQQSRGNWIDAEQQAQRVRELEAQLAETRKVENAARSVVEAYMSRFESGTGNYFGPIDDEITALRSALNSGGKPA